MQINILFLLMILALAAGTLVLVFMSFPGEDSEAPPPTVTDHLAESSKVVDAGSSREAEAPRDVKAEIVESDIGKEPVYALDGDRNRVRGRIIDPQGNPLAGVRIGIKVTEGVLDFPLRDPDGEDTGILSGPDGRFVVALQGASVPRTHLGFTLPRWIPVSIPLIQAIPCIGGEYALDDITMKPAYMVRGKAVDAQGTPVPGCRVSLRGIPHEASSFGGMSPETDDSGRFWLASERDRPVKIWAYHDSGLVGFLAGVTPVLDPEPVEVRILLERALPIAGRLLRADGSPAPGKSVFLEGSFREGHIRQSLKTEDRGGFRFHPVPEGRYVIKARRVTRAASGEDAFHMILAEDVPAGTEDLLFTLPESSEVLLRLAMEDGAPVTDQPRLQFKTPESVTLLEKRSSHFWSHDVESLEPGVFLFRGVFEGVYEVLVKTKGYRDHTFESVTVPPPPGRIELMATLSPGAFIAGRVLHADGAPAAGVVVDMEADGTDSPFAGFHNVEKPLENMRFCAFSNEGIRTRGRGLLGILRSRKTLTDSAGVFRYEPLTKGRYYLFFRVDGHEVFGHPPVEITDEAPCADLEITLPSLEGSISGMVLDHIGTPLPGACVVSWDGEDLFHITRSDAQGRYAFQGLPDGRYVVDARMITRVTSQGGGSTRGIRGNPEVPEEAWNAVIRDGLPCTLDLRISDPWDGVVEVFVTATGAIPLSDRLRVTIREVEGPEGKRKFDEESYTDLFRYKPGKKKTMSGPHHIRFIDLRAGYYEVFVTWANPATRKKSGLTGYSDRSWEHVESLLLEPSEKRRLDIRVEALDLAGLLVDGVTGKPIPSASLQVRRAGNGEPGNFHDLKTDEEGRFHFENIPAGAYDLVFRHDGYRPLVVKDYPVTARAAQKSIRFVLEPGGHTLRGVLDTDARKENRAEGRRAPSWYVVPDCLPLEPIPSLGVAVDEDGAFTLKNLPSGPVKLIVFRYRTKIAERMVELPLEEGSVFKIVVE